MPRNSFRLGAKDAGHYLRLFNSAPIIPAPPELSRRFGRSDQVIVTVGEGDLVFEIWMDAIDGVVDPAHLGAVRFVLMQVVEMDDVARAIPSTVDHDEVLARIRMTDTKNVRFRYFATAVNTEWDVGFALNANGLWECRGIQPPRQ